MIFTSLRRQRTIARSILSLHYIASTDPSVKNLLALGELKPGWYYGEGERPAFAEILSAFKIIELMKSHSIKTVETFPGIGGEILVSGYWQDKTFDITCFPGGEFDFEYEEDDVTIESAEGISLDEIKKKIGARMCQPGKSSAYFTHTITVRQSSATRVRRSASHQRTAAFPLSISTVFDKAQNPFVITSQSSTPSQLRVIPQFSGASPMPYYPQIQS